MIVKLPSGSFDIDDIGTGMPVVLLHGFPHTRELWSQQISALSLQVRCIAPDLRGLGGSVVEGPWTIDRYADDVRELLDHLGIERAVIAGLSMGGYIAMACWRRFPSRVQALALLDTQANADDEAGRAKRESLIARARTEGIEAVVEAQLPGMVGKTTREERPDVVAKMAAMMRSASVDGVVGAINALRDRPDSSDTLRSVTVPTLIVVGDEDVLTPPSKAQQIADLLPSGTQRRFDVVSGAGHVTCVERPSAVTHAMSEFLALVQHDRLT